MTSKRAVFLDKDGTLIEDVPYNVDPDQVRLTEGALEGLQRLYRAGYQIIVASNQSGVARGLFKEEALIPIHQRLEQLLAEAGVPLDGFYYCPHLPDAKVLRYAQTCFCRKPSPGLLFQAGREHGINLAASWFIGDILNDIEAGRRADCRTILVDNGNETDWKLSPLRQPHYTVKNLLEAARTILECDEQRPVQISRPAGVKYPSTGYQSAVTMRSGS